MANEEEKKTDTTIPPSDPSESEGTATEGEGKAGWKIAQNHVKNLNIMKQAVGKVKLENKIGKPAADLDDSDPLKALAMATQRSIREFSKGGKGTVKLEENGVRCTESCQHTFREIRKAFGVTETQFYAVLGLQEGARESSYSVIGSSDASGKSASFFFLSPDQRFILKSCTKRDVTTLVDVLQNYSTHLQSCVDTNKDKGHNNSSLLPRYLGLYELHSNTNAFPDVTLVVMSNFFAGTYQIHKKFDLKGSTYHRQASPSERQKKSPVYKDLDWIQDQRKLTFSTLEEVASIQDQLEKDSIFLKNNLLIDYSLLVGVHEVQPNGEYRRDEAIDVLCSRTPTEIQYFGIVDILTPYHIQKKMETLCTGTLLCRPGISCQPPHLYQERFLRFCKDKVLAVADSGNNDNKVVESKKEEREEEVLC